MRIMIIAPHPDDEVLGMGGTIKKLSKKNNILLTIISEGATAQYTDKKMIQIRKDSCKKSAKILGISDMKFLEFPDMKLENIPQLKINKKLEEIISKFKPETVYTSPNNDLNLDHKKVFESTLVVTRPTSNNIKKVFAYELPGHKKNPFNPNVFEDISKEIKYKIQAFKKYKTEIMKFPHPRSIEAIENLAIQRGIDSGLKRAEAFQLIRSIVD